jgi:formylglycine-generating enzyme required for sulfatase activity
LEEKLLTRKVVPDPTPINWRELEKMFREEYRLDRLDYGHLGTTRDRLEHKLELQKVYIALNVKDRSFDRIMQAAKVKGLTLQQQRNLPLLFQRFDELLHLEHEKEQRMIAMEKEVDEKQSHVIAQKILEECKSPNLRNAGVIIAEIMSSQRMKRDQVYRILWTLSSWAIVPRPLANIPSKNQFHLFIGDAGGGKSTACRYLALRCFEDLKNKKSKALEREFDITGKKPLPIYLRLEDFGKLIADYPDGTRCLFECAAKFWYKEGKGKVFTAGQLYSALMQQPVWLFLDGLDEIASPASRWKLAECIKSMIQNPSFQKLRITLTSRPAAITDELLSLLDMPYYYLLELEQNQIDEFAINYFAANLPQETPDQLKKRATDFLNALKTHPAARVLATNPLLLTVIAVLHYKENKLPDYRAELYEQCIKQMMAQKAAMPGRLDTGKIVFKYPSEGKAIIEWNHDQIINVLRDLAFHALQQTESEIFLTPGLMLQRLQESDMIPDHLKSSAELESIVERFLDDCDRLIGLLAYRGGHYLFIHRTFQEYLAAHWLTLQLESNQKKQLQNMAENPAHWKEVMRLFFNRLGILDAAIGEELITEVSTTALQKKEHFSILLSAQCLSDLEEKKPRYRLHKALMSQLTTIRDQSYGQPPLFLACGDALGLMNEPHIDVFDPPMVLLDPKKPFMMGSEEYDDEKPIHPVQLSPYWIGKYPVTNKEFAEFIKQGGYEDKKYWAEKKSKFEFDGIDFWKELKEKLPRYWLNEQFGRSRPLAPVVGISWYEAMAYCMWLTEKNPGKKFRLPTEAEWEFAARVGNSDSANYNQGRNYPWGDTTALMSERMNYSDSKLEQTSAVGSYPNGTTPDDIFDLAGNAWEWCYDWYDEDYYQNSPQNNPKGPSSSPIGARVLRGGSWGNNEWICRSTNRNRYNPDNRNNNWGFRVVQDSPH